MAIKVLWLDDEFDSEALKSTFIRMEKHFTLIKCYTKDEFLDKIECEEWDAIVLDVLDTNGRDSGFHTAVRRILKGYKDEPWFVFSGQENVTKKESDIRAMLAEEDCQREYADILYIKSEHNEKLIKDIENAVNEKPAWQLKNKYRNVFGVFDDSIQGKEQLLDILLMLHGHKNLDHQTYYTQLRLILEWIFRDANQWGLLHDKCIDEKGKVNLTESSLFMAGKPAKHLGIYCDIAHFPKIIANNVKNLLNITGGASHTAEPEKNELVNLHSYWEQVKTPYLLYSLTFMLCDILIWHKKYKESNSNYSKNVALWKSIEPAEYGEGNIVSGVITNFDNAGRAFLRPDGATQKHENCSIDPKEFSEEKIQRGSRFTVQYKVVEIEGNKPMRIVDKIIKKDS